MLGIDTVHVDYLPSIHKTKALDGVVDISQTPFFQYVQSLEEEQIGVWAEERLTTQTLYFAIHTNDTSHFSSLCAWCSERIYRYFQSICR